MASANASGDIFAIGGGAGFEGLISGHVNGRARVGIEIEAEACHGVYLEASALALAEINAAISMFLGASGSASAFAGAGVRGQLQLAPNLFKQFGLSADVAAYAEASAAARLAISLDFNALAVLARDQLHGPALEVGIAFLREIVVEGGVWAKASAAAMVQVHVAIQGKLTDDEDAGFFIELGGGAAVGVGAGVDWFLGIRFTNVRRFYATAVDIVTREAVQLALLNAPPALVSHVGFLDLFVPIALHTAYELGQQSALGTLHPAEYMVAPFLGAVGREVYRFAIDRLAEASGNMLAGVIEEVTLVARQKNTTTGGAAHEALRTTVEYLLANEAMAFDRVTILDLGDRVAPIISAIAPALSSHWRHAIAACWSAVACAESVRDTSGYAGASGGVSFVGFGGVEGAAVWESMPSTPTRVLEAYGEILGRPFSTVAPQDAVEYLVHVGIVDQLPERVPEAHLLLSQLSRVLGLSLADFVESALHRSTCEDKARLDLYALLRDFAKDALDNKITHDLLPGIQAAIGDDESTYVRDVVQPSVSALSSFVFSRLDAIVGASTGAPSPFLESLAQGLSTVVYRIFLRNVLFLDQVITDHLLDRVPGAFQILADQARGSQDHVWVQALRSLIPSQLPDLPLVSVDIIAAYQQLAGDLAIIGRDASGPGVWTVERRRRLRDAKRELLLGFEGQPASSDSAGFEEFVRSLITCSTVPNEQALIRLASLQAEIMVDEIGLVLPRAVEALAAFYLRATRAIVEEIDRRIREILKALADVLQMALDALQVLVEIFLTAYDEAKAAAKRLEDAMEAVSDVLRDDEIKEAAKAEIYRIGDARARRDAAAVGLPEGPASYGFGIVFAAAEPAIDVALSVIGDIAAGLADILEGALGGVGAIKSLAESIVDAVKAKLEGAGLPSELGPGDVAQALADSLPTGTLITLLDEAVAASQASTKADEAESRASENRDQGNAAYEKALGDLASAEPAGPPSVLIMSPASVTTSLEERWTHGTEVMLRIYIGGAKRSFVDSGTRRRVRLAINGRVVNYRSDHWTDQGNGQFAYLHELSTSSNGLKPGLNILEVSIADGVAEVARQVVSFVVSGSATSLKGRVAFVPAESSINPLGDDNKNPELEYVAMRWNGDTSLALGGWRLLDLGAKHAYVFKSAREIEANRTLILVTGGSPADDSRDRVFWGRGSAVWNNTGDWARLIDNNGILRAESLLGLAE